MRFRAPRVLIIVNLAVLVAVSVSFLLIRNAVAQSATSTPTDPLPADTSSETLSTAAAAASIDAAPQLQQLREVHIIGTKYTDYFTDGSTVFSFPGDPEIAKNFDKPNAPQPSHEGLMWVQTTGTHLYDTPSGDLEIGTFALQQNGTYVAYLATTTIANATSTPYLPARVVVMQEHPVTGAQAPRGEVKGASTSATNGGEEVGSASTTLNESRAVSESTTSASTTNATAQEAQQLPEPPPEPTTNPEETISTTTSS